MFPSETFWVYKLVSIIHNSLNDTNKFEKECDLEYFKVQAFGNICKYMYHYSEKYHILQTQCYYQKKRQAHHCQIPIELIKEIKKFCGELFATKIIIRIIFPINFSD